MKTLNLTQEEIQELEIALQYQVDAVILPKIKQVKATQSREDLKPHVDRLDIISSILKKVNKLAESPNPVDKTRNF